ncbi:MAG TPA: hypothetical protein VJB66_05755 [Candidatus Nanoarchaeia archaeon]|nr:hypothetical protein [Candidatus Nanoarchaeia archaeon]
MQENSDYINYLIGVGGIIVTVAGLFAQEYKILIIVTGLIGTVGTFVMVNMNTYVNKIHQHSKEIKEMKQNLDYFQKHIELSEKIKLLEKRVYNKRGSMVFYRILQTTILVIMIYMFLVAIGVVKV